MRLDKYLKVSRLIKRRTVANEVCSAGRVSINDRQAKPGAEVKVGDRITVRFGNNVSVFEVLSIAPYSTKENASSMYRLISGTEID